MAPSVIVPAPVSVDVIEKKLEKVTVSEVRTGNKFGYVPGVTKPDVQGDEPYYADEFLPAFPDVKWEPLEEVEYEDKGILGDPEYKDLLDAATDVFDYTPKIGTEIHGVKLNKLTDAQKNDLARLIAHRGVVFFRDQEDLTIEQQLDLGRYFGKLHKHATTAMPKREGLDEVHVVYADKNSKVQAHLAKLKYFIHSDVSYELNPPSYTSLKILDGPNRRAGGGDTIWHSGYAAYDALSPHMQKYLEGLTALHSAKEQADGSRRGGKPVRRHEVVSEHPIVRTHPVTGWKALYYNPGFIVGIKGVPRAESDVILDYLNDVVASIPENQVRFRWENGSVAYWDNRIVTHTAVYDTFPYRRHAVRATTIGERPYFDPAGKSQQEETDRILGREAVLKDGAAGLANYND